ncbi:MAG: Bax inhibitor-1 family protein [Lactobacillus sp.]|jgi:FtsH-binding integral membrane protein
MNNFSAEPQKTNRALAGVNGFLSKMYGVMCLAVLISALTSFLTIHVFGSQMLTYFANHQAMVWILLLLPFGLSLGISFNAYRNPAAGLIMLIAVAVIYGLEFALISYAYTGAEITAAFVSSASVFAAMAIFGTFTKRDLSNWGAYASAALIGLLVAWLINMFVRSNPAALIFSFIAVIIFTALTAYDAQTMKRIYQQYGGQVSENGLAILGAFQLYLDFINLFLQLLQIFGMTDRRN